MLAIITGESLKGYKNNELGNRTIKKMDKYAQMKRCHNECWIQVYIYAFMYVDPAKIPEEE